MTYDGGSWKRELLDHVPLALMPYALLFVVWFASRLFHMHPSVRRALTWSVIVIALVGPPLYLDALFIHADAQGALAMLIPAFPRLRKGDRV